MNPHQRLIELLEQHNCSYKVIEHQETPTSQDSAKARGEPLKIGAKALVLKSKQGFSIAVLPANRRANTKLLKKALASKSLRFANSEELFELTGLSKGAVPPFGHLFELPTLIDPALFEEETMAFNAACLTTSIKMKSADYKQILESLDSYQIVSFSTDSQ